MDFLLALPCWSSDGYCTRGILGFPTLFSLSLSPSLPFLERLEYGLFTGAALLV